MNPSRRLWSTAQQSSKSTATASTSLAARNNTDGVSRAAASHDLQTADEARAVLSARLGQAVKQLEEVERSVEEIKEATEKLQEALYAAGDVLSVSFTGDGHNEVGDGIEDGDFAVTLAASGTLTGDERRRLVEAIEGTELDLGDASGEDKDEDAPACGGWSDRLPAALVRRFPLALPGEAFVRGAVLFNDESFRIFRASFVFQPGVYDEDRLLGFVSEDGLDTLQPDEHDCDPLTCECGAFDSRVQVVLQSASFDED